MTSRPPTTTLDAETLERGERAVAADKQDVSAFWTDKYKREASKSWDLFYKRNKTHFFKDRHWTDREFEELRLDTSNCKSILEVGCGVGNFIFPLIETRPTLKVYACDFSSRAVATVKEHELYDPVWCHAFVCDLTTDKLLDNVPSCSVDLVSMIFVLSAIPPEKMANVMENIASVLKTGGKVLFRDYALYDEAQLRFKPGHRMQQSLYVRQDGTMAYYFTIDELRLLAEKCGFDVETCVYIYKEMVNRKQGVHVDRIFVQAKLIKR